MSQFTTPPNNNNKENSKKILGDMISDVRQKHWGKHCGLNYVWNIKDWIHRSNGMVIIVDWDGEVRKHRQSVQASAWQYE
jgi:hypothetical protein